MAKSLVEGGLDSWEYLIPAARIAEINEELSPASLARDFPPDRALTTAIRVSGTDLRWQTLEFLAANAFRGPTAEEMGALKPRGYDLVLSAAARQLSLVVTENPDHFEDSGVDYINARSQVRNYIPPALTVVLRSGELFLADSFNKSQPVQLQMTETESRAVQELVPDARSIMLPAATVAQLDLNFLRKTGRVLFRDRFVRALDKTSGVRVASVGRSRPDDRLLVGGSDRGIGDGVVGALSAVVFIRR